MIAIAVLDDDGKDLGRVTALVEAFASCRSLLSKSVFIVTDCNKHCILLV